MASLVSNNAVSTLASLVAQGATSLTLATGEGALFPAITNPVADFFYLKIGDDTTNEVVKCSARTTDTLTCSAIATVGGWAAGTAVTLTVCKELVDTFTRLNNDNITINVVEAGGADYQWTVDAFLAIKDINIAKGKIVTINLPGHDSSGGDITDEGIPNSDRVKLVGTTYGITLNSVQSVSGTAGARSYVLNIASVANISVGDFVIFPSPTGGTNPDCLIGAHEVTAVDSGLLRITVTVSHQAAYTASGAVTDSGTVMKSVLDCSGYNGFIVTDKGFALEDVVLKGNGSKAGIYAASPSAMMSWLEQSKNVVISGFSTGICLAYGAKLYSFSTVYVSNCSVGLQLSGGSSCSMPYLMITGCYTGMDTYQSDFTSSYLFGSSYSGATSPNIYGCDTGIWVEQGSRIKVQGVIKDNATLGINANTYSYVEAISATFTGNTTDCSPVINTQGNVFAYIKV